ncbi:Hypothetical protein GLP15_2214 [Giardia lamblia P15]|uniref:Uncharacterized protein n=1 Tax=Giardia intestinalis (strain P15) TaxID=658858 RepID=E1F6T7_GIAIA|nr:Hypothetical protein GLP15_2214 [Giardia lamblia P15]
MLLLSLAIWVTRLETVQESTDCIPRIKFLPMRERSTEVNNSGLFLSFSYSRLCYATDSPVLQVSGCSTTIYVSTADPADEGIFGLESFEVMPDVPVILHVSNNLLRDGPLYIWADTNGRVSIPQQINVCRRAVLAIPTVSFWTERNWVRGTPDNIINADILEDRNRLLAAGIVSPAQARLLYRPVPLLASLSASTQLSDSVTVRVIYVIAEGAIPNIFDVCELPGTVEQMPNVIEQSMEVSQFLCARFRSGVWRVYNASSVPSVLPPSTLYMATTEQDKLLPSLVSYTIYSLNKSLEDRVEQTLQKTAAVSDIPNAVIFILELIGLCLFGIITIWILERACSTHGALRPKKAYLSRRWDSFPLLDISKPLNLWLLRYNSQLDLSPLTQSANWQPYARITPKFWCHPEKMVIELVQTILLPRNSKAHQRVLLLEYLSRRRNQPQVQSIYHNSKLLSELVPDDVLKGPVIIHVAPSKCNKEHVECNSPIQWMLLTTTKVTCFCNKHAPTTPQKIAIPKRTRKRCMFCLLAYGDRICLNCAGGSLLCCLCEELIHSNCKSKHRVIKTSKESPDEISTLMSECLGSISLI